MVCLGSGLLRGGVQLFSQRVGALAKVLWWSVYVKKEGGRRELGIFDFEVCLLFCSCAPISGAIISISSLAPDWRYDVPR